MAAEPALCPSGRCKPGAILLGIVLSNGSVAFAKDRIVVDREFVDAAQKGRDPERRFRFGGSCIQSACRQWTGDRCGVIDEVLDAIPEAALPSDLPECSIRPDCRWYLQSGETACRACPLVVTETRAA